MKSRMHSPLRAARESSGLTIRALRDATLIATGRISMLERCMVKPKASEQERLAAALAVPVEQLFPWNIG